jgi:hypothetical protein
MVPATVELIDARINRAAPVIAQVVGREVLPAVSQQLEEGLDRIVEHVRRWRDDGEEWKYGKPDDDQD